MRQPLPVLAPMVRTGCVLRCEALAAGLTVEQVTQLVRSGAWVRIRRGAYADREQYEALTPEQRHLVLAGAVIRALEAPAVLGHVTAAVAHGLPVWGADLSAVHVIRPARQHGSRHEAGVTHHSAALPDGHVAEVDGLPVTTVARTLVDHARTTPYESAVATLDGGLHGALVAPGQLRSMLRWQQDWPGSRGAGRAVAFADGRSESVGESRARVRMHEAGLPVPRLQPLVRDPRGVLVGRVDFLIEEHSTIGEFDGRIKYRAERGARPEDVVWQEKLREDRLRALGFQVVRFTWDDLNRGPLWLRRMFFEAFARAATSAPPIGLVA